VPEYMQVLVAVACRWKSLDYIVYCAACR